MPRRKTPLRMLAVHEPAAAKDEPGEALQARGKRSPATNRAAVRRLASLPDTAHRVGRRALDRQSLCERRTEIPRLSWQRYADGRQCVALFFTKMSSVQAACSSTIW